MNKTFLAAALAGILAASAAQAHDADDKPGKEKCYGISKAGQNECASASGSHDCAGEATKDNDPGEWKFVGTGECKKLKGSLTPKA